MLIEMTPEHYDALLDKVPQNPLAYSLLKNGIVNYSQKGGAERRVIHIECEPFQAEILLGLAKDLWPEAAYEIQQRITRSSPLQ